MMEVTVDLWALKQGVELKFGSGDLIWSDMGGSYWEVLSCIGVKVSFGKNFQEVVAEGIVMYIWELHALSHMYAYIYDNVCKHAQDVGEVGKSL